MSAAEALYARSPVWLQHVLISAKGWQFRYRRSRDSIIRHELAFLLRSQRFTLERHRDYQDARLRQLLATAFAHVPYYRDLARNLGCSAADFSTVDDLRRLPVLEKSTVRGNEAAFLNETIDVSRCTTFVTSGTTGTPLKVYETQESWSRRMAFVARLRVWAGLKDAIAPRRVQFTGRTIVPSRQHADEHVYWRRNIPGNALVCSTTHLSPVTVPYYIRAIQRYRPDLMDGYPSAMLIMARVGQRLGLELPRLKAIITTAETLLPEHRAELVQAFGCRVHDQYAATEPCCFWGDCEFGQLHISPEYGVSEILGADGAPVGAGEEGDIVTTSFLNSVMPLIRYRVGDRAVAESDVMCECGRSLPRVRCVTGRMDDILYVEERGYVGRLDPCFKGLSHIVESQIIQEELSKVRVLLVPADGYDPGIGDRLVSNLRDKLGSRISIQLDLVPRIPRGPNGKFRSVVSRVRHLYPDRMDPENRSRSVGIYDEGSTG